MDISDYKLSLICGHCDRIRFVEEELDQLIKRLDSINNKPTVDEIGVIITKAKGHLEYHREKIIKHTIPKKTKTYNRMVEETNSTIKVHKRITR